jgi:hypothetical protein
LKTDLSKKMLKALSRRFEELGFILFCNDH